MNYHNAIVTENFEREILAGHITQADVIKMIEENKLSAEEAQVVLELMPALAGLGNLAKTAGSALGKGAKNFGQAIANKVNTVGSNIKQGVQQGVQNVQNTYQQGKNVQMQKNALKQFQSTWDNTMSRSLKGVAQTFANDADITKAVASIQQWANYLEQLITKTIQGPTQQQQPAQQQPVAQQQQPAQDDSRWQPPANMVQRSQPQTSRRRRTNPYLR